MTPKQEEVKDLKTRLEELMNRYRQKKEEASWAENDFEEALVQKEIAALRSEIKRLRRQLDELNG